MKRPERVKSNREHSQDLVWKTLRPIVFDTSAGAATCTVLLLVFPLISVAAKQLFQSLPQPITVLIAALGASFAGYAAARMPGERGMLYGAGPTLLPSGLLFLAGLTVSGESVPAFISMKGPIMVLTGAIAGILSVNKKSR